MDPASRRPCSTSRSLRAIECKMSSTIGQKANSIEVPIAASMISELVGRRSRQMQDAIHPKLQVKLRTNHHMTPVSQVSRRCSVGTATSMSHKGTGTRKQIGQVSRLAKVSKAQSRQNVWLQEILCAMSKSSRQMGQFSPLGASVDLSKELMNLDGAAFR